MKDIIQIIRQIHVKSVIKIAKHVLVNLIIVLLAKIITFYRAIAHAAQIAYRLNFFLDAKRASFHAIVALIKLILVQVVKTNTI